ncbi:pilus assembly protein [Bifidobacterium felsineum]|nr:pilus assembly protein [Bifidobacterium felsineum]
MRFWCAVLLAIAVLVWPRPIAVAARMAAADNVQRTSRQQYSDIATNGPALHAAHIGIASMLTALIARMNSGGTLIEAVEEQYGSRFATRELTEARLRRLCERVKLPDETPKQVTRIAQSMYAASQVSSRLGCRASPCLEVTLTAYRQMRLLQNLTTQALAVPKATVALLSALPIVTILLGELLGARPLEFLLDQTRGLVCLLLGACCYAAGLLWVCALLRERA